MWKRVESDFLSDVTWDEKMQFYVEELPVLAFNRMGTGQDQIMEKTRAENVPDNIN